MKRVETTPGGGRGPRRSDDATARRGRELAQLHLALRRDGRNVTPAALLAALAAQGFPADDPRLAESVERLRGIDPAKPLSLEAFAAAVQPNLMVIEKALTGRAVLPEFAEFGRDVGRIFDETRGNGDGRVASYIPQLAQVDPDLFGVSLCTIDGQRLALGDATHHFSVQSCCKPTNYCLALEEHGAEAVHRHVGCEPSGRSFNELALNDKGLPHNPMINSGAIMSSSMIRAGLSGAERFEYVVDAWRRMSGGDKPGFNNSVYLSERQTADRNFALGYSMRESGAFPEGTDLLDALEFYFQCCSLDVTAELMAISAATLANGGVCPTTGERVFQPDTVQKCLSMMYSCGMYDLSGEWAFTVGLPAKSGVSGAVVVVVPNVLGLCVWSPRLDPLGNSVRGVAFCRELVRTFNFHNYDNLVGGMHAKKDPRRSAVAARSDDVVTFCWAASEGDVTAIRRMVARGVPPDGADYDGRTAIHLAAAEGHLPVVRFLADIGAALTPVDRWGGTPYDDATRAGHTEIAEYLKQRRPAQARSA